MDDITTAVAALGPGPLQDTLLRRCVDPLFSRVLGTNPGTIYLANHSLGRPLDRMQADLERYTAAWYDNLGGAWEEWLAEVGAFRANVGALINAPKPGCIVPKTSAGQGLRAVLNCFDRPIRVLTTRSEFDSIDFLLKSFAGRGRVELQWIAPRANRLYGEEDFIDGLGQKPDLVVFLSFFTTPGSGCRMRRRSCMRRESRGPAFSSTSTTPPALCRSMFKASTLISLSAVPTNICVAGRAPLGSTCIRDGSRRCAPWTRAGSRAQSLSTSPGRRKRA